MDFSKGSLEFKNILKNGYVKRESRDKILQTHLLKTGSKTYICKTLHSLYGY